jgi:CRP/FNR family transcriptional regulator, cyclic AMP receptor protein
VNRTPARQGIPGDEDSGRVADEPLSEVSLLRVWPDITGSLAPEERGVAERALLAPLVTACDEDLAAALAVEPGDAFNFVLVSGTVLKETTLASSSALELLGPGDVLAPPLSATRQLEFRAASRYLALGDASIATLGMRFERVAMRWPQVSGFLHRQIAEQAHRASMHLAMLHMSRAEDRILALFADLGERFGRVTPDGILIDLPLSHELIGRLTASRRPTATIALQNLSQQGLLTRHADNSWKLALSGIPR